MIFKQSTLEEKNNKCDKVEGTPFLQVEISPDSASTLSIRASVAATHSNSYII